jgi:hypothetical protein
LLFRDTSGDLAIWFMNGMTITQSAVVGNVPTNLAVAGSDMHGDIFWRDSASGDVSMWVMSGTSVTSTAALGVVPLSWTISAVGDFDNNGSTDLLWRDTSGNVAMWLLNGTAVQSTSVMANVPLNWTVRESRIKRSLVDNTDHYTVCKLRLHAYRAVVCLLSWNG